MLMRTQESKERPRVRPSRRTVPARRDLRPSPKQRGRMDPYHDRVLERERVAVEDCVAYHGRSFAPAWEGLRGGSGRRGRAAGGAEHDVGGEHVTLAIERRWACRGTRRRLAGRRTHELLSARSGRVRPNMGHLQAHHEAPGPRLCLAASGRRRKGNHRTAEWTLTNGAKTLQATNFLELRQAGLWPFVSERGRVRSSPARSKEVIEICVPYLL